MQLCDRGYWIPEGDPHEGLKRGDLRFSLEGDRLMGRWVLVRMKNDGRGGKRTNRLLIKHRDDDARGGDGDALLTAAKSIASGRNLDAITAGRGKAPTPFITRKPNAAGAVWGFNNMNKPAKSSTTTAMPRFIGRQLCKLAERATSDPSWAHEVKFDGYRMQLRVEITVIQLNDSDAYFDLHQEVFWLGGQSVYRPAGGYARIATLVKQIRAANQERVPFCDCGDVERGYIDFKRVE